MNSIIIIIGFGVILLLCKARKVLLLLLLLLSVALVALYNRAESISRRLDFGAQS